MVKYAGVDSDVLSLLPCTADIGGLTVLETAALVGSEADCVAKIVLVADSFI